MSVGGPLIDLQCRESRHPSGLKLDHIVWATPHLQAGVEEIERLTGIHATAGGRHPGRGTHNALLSLGDRCYLEIIAPDPSQDLNNNLGASINALQSSGVYSFCMQTSDMPALVTRASTAYVAIKGPDAWHRDQPDGTRLEWLLAFTDETEFGTHVPFYIDWQSSPHPATTAAQGLALESFCVSHPHAKALTSLYKALGIGMVAHETPAPSLQAVLRTPRGKVVLDYARRS